MVDKRIEEIAEKMSQEGKEIYLAMIAPYQSGYADYVFQTEKIATQARRIKNLDKNFRRLLTEPYFWIQPMSQDSAEQIAAWTYPAPYDFYDMVADEEDLAQLLSESTRENTYFEVIRNGALFGFASFQFQNKVLEIGLGMKPDQTGKGLGVNFYQAIEDYARKNFDCRVLQLSVASFNQRALALYQQVGYEIAESYQQATNGGEYPFFRLEKCVEDVDGINMEKKLDE